MERNPYGEASYVQFYRVLTIVLQSVHCFWAFSIVLRSEHTKKNVSENVCFRNVVFIPSVVLPGTPGDRQNPETM